MDRNRDSRRSSLSMAASNGISRRRQKTTTLRDSHEEDGQVDLQETVSLRDRGSKRERDRELPSRNKRTSSSRIRRLEPGVISNREEGEDSTDESLGDEDDYEIEEGGVSMSRILPSNATTAAAATTTTITATSSSFSAIPSHNYGQKNKSLQPPPRVHRQAPAFKVADEMVGISVPRKARTACVKRSHENWIVGNGGFGEDPTQMKASTSSASRSGEAASPSSSNVSVRKKMKSSGPKTRLPKVSKSSSSGQEDLEFEIAEVLFGLKKQSHGSKKEETSENVLQKFESKDANGLIHDSKISPTLTAARTSVLALINDSGPDPLLASKKVKVEVDSSSVQNISVASVIKDGSEKTADIEVSPPKSGSYALGAACTASSGLREEAIKQGDMLLAFEESGAAAKEKSATLEKESATCSKMVDDFQDSKVAKTMPNVSTIENQGGEKFKIDLMAPPPMASSPEQDSFVNLSSLDPKPMAQDGEVVSIRSLAELISTANKTENMGTNDERVERVMKEAVVVEFDDKTKTSTEKVELNFDLQKQSHDSGNENTSKLQQKQQLKAGISNVVATAQPSSVPFPIALASWPSGLLPLGYMPPFQTVVPTDGTTVSPSTVKHTHFPLSQPSPKRCATHHYIALNIRMHQQFTKMNHFWPAAAGSAALCGAKPNNVSIMPCAENKTIGNPLQGSFPVMNLNSFQEKVQALANFPVVTPKYRSSEGANFVETTQKKQLAPHQSSQPAPAGNLLHGPAFILSLSQHQASVTATATANQAGPSKSPVSISNASVSGSASAGVAANSAALPAVAAAVSFNYPNLATNEAPYLTILPNNGYPFPVPVPAPVGSPPPFKSGKPNQALPCYNGSFYPSQILHSSQLQHQPPHSQQNASTSSGPSSSHKQPQTQLPHMAPMSSHNFLVSTIVQPQQPQRHRNLENEINGESTPISIDTRTSHSKKAVHSQNLMVPLQPNFTLMPSPTVVGGGIGNHGDKQQQQQCHAKNLKSGIELVPSQAFAVPFPSFSGANTVANLNFSCMAPNPAILQSLPDMTRHGYQVVSAAQAQKKNPQLSDGKTRGSSTNTEEGKKNSLGKSTASVGQTLVFDNPARTLNFVSSPFTGNWPPQAAPTTSASMATNQPNSQQQQLLQLQKQHLVHQQPQHPTGASRSKAMTPNILPSSSVGSKFSNNVPVFSQNHAQSNSSPQNPQWKNSLRTPVASNPSAHKNVSRPQGRAPQGHGQISFGGISKSALVPQGNQVPLGNKASSILVSGSPPRGGTLRAASVNKFSSSVPALQSPQGDNTSTGNTQKSSPVCRRNVPSILSTCPSHISELKY